MILGAELGILLFGLYVLFSGKYNLGKGRVLTGAKARLLGVLCLLPIPLAFAAGVLAGLFMALTGGPAPSTLLTTVLEIVILVVVVVLVSGLGKMFYDQQAPQGN